jgi:hypothetical protein
MRRCQHQRTNDIQKRARRAAAALLIMEVSTFRREDNQDHMRFTLLLSVNDAATIDLPSCIISADE